VSLLLVAVQGGLNATSFFTVSTPLASQTTKLRVVFWDFDKTLMINSFGDYILLDCDPNCLDYNSYSCLCNTTTQQLGDFYNANYSINSVGGVHSGQFQGLNGSDMKGLNGTDRRDRLIQTLQHLQSQGVILRVLSTSWAWIGNASWAYFLEQVFIDVGLDQWFNASTIMTLDDPGAGISGPKGPYAKQLMDANGWSGEEGLLVDDSTGNIDSATAAGVGWLKVIPKSGFALDTLQWIEQRADQTRAPTMQPTMQPTGPTAAPTTAVPTTVAPTGEPTTAAPTGAPTTAAPNTGAPTMTPTVAANNTTPTATAPTAISGGMSLLPGFALALLVFLQ